MHQFVIATLTLATLLFDSASAQVHASLSVSQSSAHGYAANPDGMRLKPAAIRTLALSLAADHGSWRLQLGGRYLEAGLAVSGDGISLVTLNAIKAIGLAAVVQRRIVGQGPAPSLHVGAGVEAMRWTFTDAADDARWRLAGLAAIEGSIRLVAPWRGLLRAEAAIGRSLFEARELPPGYGLRHAWRHGLAVGLSRAW